MGKLTVWTLNIRGLRSNFSYLSIQVATDKPDIICLTETFLPKTCLTPKYLPGYSLLRYDRPELRPGGGVVLFIKDSIPHSPRTALTPPPASFTASCQDNCLTTSFNEPRAGGRVGQLKTRGDISVHEGEQVSLKEFPG